MKGYFKYTTQLISSKGRIRCSVLDEHPLTYRPLNTGSVFKFAFFSVCIQDEWNYRSRWLIRADDILAENSKETVRKSVTQEARPSLWSTILVLLLTDITFLYLTLERRGYSRPAVQKFKVYETLYCINQCLYYFKHSVLATERRSHRHTCLHLMKQNPKTTISYIYSLATVV